MQFFLRRKNKDNKKIFYTVSLEKKIRTNQPFYQIVFIIQLQMMILGILLVNRIVVSQVLLVLP